MDDLMCYYGQEYGGENDAGKSSEEMKNIDGRGIGDRKFNGEKGLEDGGVDKNSGGKKSGFDKGGVDKSNGGKSDMVDMVGGNRVGKEDEGNGVDMVRMVERSRRCALPLSCIILKPYYRLLHYSALLQSNFFLITAIS